MLSRFLLSVIFSYIVYMFVLQATKPNKKEAANAHH